MENLACFQMTSNFGSEYLQKGWRYSKSDKYFIDCNSSRVWRKKSSELCRVPAGQRKLEKVREFVWSEKVRERSGENIIF